METTLALDHERAPDGHTHIVRALLKITADVPEAVDRVPVNLSIVLDRSGSMSGRPLAEAKQAASLLVQRLRPDDVASVVAYDDHVETVADPSTGEQRSRLLDRIRSIESGGSTNLSGGWLRGRDLVAARKREGGANRVLLLTDGMANVGITEPDRLIELCRRASAHGITTTTMGFGEHYNEVLLRSMAEVGGGNTYYIEHPNQATPIFAQEIDGLLSLGAQNLAVSVRTSGAARLLLVHQRYASHATEDGVTLELGDLYASMPRMLLAEFAVPSMDPSATEPIADFVVTAHVVMPGGGLERQEIRLPVRASFADGPVVDPEVRRELLLQEAARAREDAYQAISNGDHQGARERLSEMSGKLRAFGPTDAVVREQAEDLRQMAERFRTEGVHATDAKYLYQRSYETRRGRNSDAISRVRDTDRKKGDGGSDG